MKLFTKTILLVEDEAILGLAEKTRLTEEGFNVIHVLHGREAIETVEKNPDSVDLVLMDIDLGTGMDGTEAAEVILKIKDIPVIFLTSHTEKEIVDKTEKITSYGYVVKESGPTVLLASIKMAFKLYEAKKEILEKKAEMYRQEETLRYSLNLLKNYVKHAKNAIAIFDRNMQYLYYSDKYIADYNLEWRDLTGLSHYDVFPEIPYRWKTIHRAALKGEVLSAVEDVFPRSNGKIDWVNWECSPWYETDGTIGGIILNSEVVTEHVNAVHKVKKYSAAFNSARWGILVTSGDMKKVDLVNKEFARMHGYTVEE
ncbi:MAG: response regulator, partial [Syntrophothermus sp.]